MYTPAPDFSPATALGFLPTDFEDDEDDQASGIWPDNWPAVRVFGAMGTQWRTGVAGATGLDYSALQAVYRLTETPEVDQPEIFDALQIMEDEALKAMQEHREAIDRKNKP